MFDLTRSLENESATVAAGEILATALQPGMAYNIYLTGVLGAGKTTLIRGMLQGLGYQGRVKSPTYALVETYEMPPRVINHFDLYRLSDPEEIEFMGIRDYIDFDTICLFEWPDKGKGYIPEPDLTINLKVNLMSRLLEVDACSSRGEQLLMVLKEQI